MFELSDKYSDEPRTLSIGRIKVRWPFPIVMGLHSSSATVFGYPVYGGKEKRWVNATHRVFCAISDAKRWCKYRLKPTDYHHLDTGLSPGYHDPRAMLLYAAFAALGRYIDEQGGIEGCRDYIRGFQNTEYQHQSDTESEILSIWLWWIEELPKMRQERDRMQDELFGDGKCRISWVKRHSSEFVMEPPTDERKALGEKFRALEEKIRQDKQTMLHRLIDVREYLWT